MINAQNAKKLADDANKFKEDLHPILKQIEVAAKRGEYRINVMHSREYTTIESRSLIGDHLTNLGFDVDTSNAIDRKENNFRRIGVSWE